jgi:hypothetical protein
MESWCTSQRAVLVGAMDASRPARAPEPPSFVLVDPHMVADLVWYRWLDAGTPGCRRSQWNTRRVFPVALDPTAYNLPVVAG